MKSKLTQSRLKEVLHYDPETGIFTWKMALSWRVRVGATAGSEQKSGYIEIGLDGYREYAHRLAFLYMEGYFPEHQVDHRNGLRTDNRWENLRHVVSVCNMQNCAVSAANVSGFTGVSWATRDKKWRAQAKLNYKVFGLGHYDSALEAALARITFEDWCAKWHCDERSENRKNVFAAAGLRDPKERERNNERTI